MCRHIVVALKRVAVVRFALLDKAVEDGIHINTHVRIGILVNGKSRTCVLDEKIEQPCLRKSYSCLAQTILYFIGYEMESARTLAQRKCCLLYHTKTSFFCYKLLLISSI